jgi:ATP-binding cassette subfamily B protein
VERKAFNRAWRFLNYKPAAKWTALAAAVFTGVIYVGLLFTLGLFADLIVNRGHIPIFRALSQKDRDSFQKTWTAHNTSETVSEETSEQERKERAESLQAIGVIEDSARRLARRDFSKMSSPEQELIWRAQVYRILNDRVGAGAAVLVLPELRELPNSVQMDFGQYWRSLLKQDRRLKLSILEEENAGARVEALLGEDTSKLSFEDWETIWRCHLYQLQDSPSVANGFWRDRKNRFETESAAANLSYPELADRGILGLIVRTYDRSLAVLYNPVLGFIANWNPWMWKSGSATRPNYQDYLTGLLIAAVLLALLRALVMFVMNYSAALATIEASNRLRRAVYHHTFRLGTLAFRALGPSEAVGIFTRQIEAVHEGLYTWLTVVYREPVKFGLILLVALALNVWLTLAFLVFAFLVWVVGGQVAVYFRSQEREANRRASNQLALLQESLMMMRLVKCYLMELFNQARVERQLAKYSDDQLRRYRGKAIYRPVLLFLGSVAAVVLLYVAGLIVLSGQLGVARSIMLATTLVSLYWPVVHWLENRRSLRRGRQAAEVIFKFLDRPGEVGQVVGAEFLPPLQNKLEFDNVSFKEPGTGKALLQGVSLTVEAGQRVALVGPEDMEKHALVYLIPRFLDPTSGEIRIDSHNLRWVTFDSLRAQIAIVLQHNLVFNDTVANNIGCGDPGYDLPKIIDAAKIAHAHQFIQKLPRGYETLIGEMGHNLNVGEQFRIALARAILRDPALFIIEEPAALIDDDTKDLVDDTLARVLPGRTVIFLPHRISTIRSCHRIFLLHNGRVEAAGEHREMLTQSELYRHLQYLEFNVFSEQLAGKNA